MNKKLLLCIFLLYFPACETLYGISPKALIQFISEHTESLCYVYEVTPTSIKYFTAAILAKYLVDKLLTTFIKYEFTSDFLLNCLYYMGARADAQLLRTACMDNNTALALRCLKYGADPRKAVYMLPSPLSIEKCRGKIHYTNALHLATHHNNTDVINALYVKGADINNLDYKGETPLLFANTDETIKLLINKGALAPYVLPAEQRSHVVKEHEHFSDPTILGLILGKLQKNMIINDEIKNFVTRVCNDEIKCDTATVDLFDFCSKKCPLWIRELYDCLYRHIEESDCNALLLKLFNHDHTSQKFDHITFQAVIVHDDVQFIEKIIEKVKEKNWFKAKEPLYYLQKACQR